MSIADYKRYSEIVRAGRTDEEMLRERMTDHPDPDKMVFTKLGDPPVVPNMRIELSNGMVVMESVFGKPPPDLPHEQWIAWFAERERQFISGEVNPNG